MAFSIIHEQKDLFASLTTPFGEKEVQIKRFSGREAISELFEFEVVFSAKNDSIDLEKGLGGSITICSKVDSKERYINGIVAECSQGATEQKGDVYFTEYSAIIRPKLWTLTLDQNYLMFQQKSAIDIIKEILKEGDIKDIEDKTRSCGKVVREYCVQYGESSFNFISRLMEDEGIFYFFKHEKNKHTLVLADASSACGTTIAGDPVGFLQSYNEKFPLNKVTDIRMTAAVNTGSFSAADYNYTLSATKLFSKLDTKWKGKMYYEYPGNFAKAKEGDDLSKLRVQLFEFPHSLFSGVSTETTMTPGFSFELKNHHAAKFNKKFIVYRVEHLFDPSANSEFIYENRFIAFEKNVEFRPPRKTPKPKIVGTQTAVVVCPSGEEIYRDKFGCIKVHFHWDQKGKDKDTDDSSCWIRVVQNLAGNNWGFLFIPRKGQEVVVTFIDGDPDKPIIVGCVYNDKYVPAYPDSEAMKSSLKTVTFKSDEGYNEFRFNDEKDKEEIFVHAQKDVNIEIENSRTTLIKESDDTLTLQKGNRSITLSAEGDNPANHTVHLVKGNSEVTLDEGDHNYTITKGNEKRELGEGNQTITLKKGNQEITLNEGDTKITLKKGNVTCEVKGNYTLKISGDLSIKADGAIKVESGKDMTFKAGTKLNSESGTDFSIKSGTSLKIKSGTDFSAESGIGMKVKSGLDLSVESTLGMKLKAGLNLEAQANVNVSLSGNVMAELKGNVSAKVQGSAMADLQGGGVVNVKGGMVMVGAMVKLG